MIFNSNFSNIIGSHGSILNVSFTDSDISGFKVIRNSIFKNIISKDGGIIMVNIGNYGELKIDNCVFEESTSKGKGGVLAVNPSWGAPPEEQQSGLFYLKVENNQFINNYQNNEDPFDVD